MTVRDEGHATRVRVFDSNRMPQKLLVPDGGASGTRLDMKKEHVVPPHPCWTKAMGGCLQRKWEAK